MRSSGPFLHPPEANPHLRVLHKVLSTNLCQMPAGYQGVAYHDASSLHETPWHGRRVFTRRLCGLTGADSPECVACLLLSEARMTDPMGCCRTTTIACPAEETNQGGRFATQLEAVWFAAHLADQEPSVAHIAGEWVVTVACEAARGAHGLPAASRA